MVYEERRDVALEDRSVSQLVNDMSEQVSRLVRDEMRLAVSEVQRKGKRVGLGAGLAGAAGVTALLAAGALVAAAIMAIALVLPGWAAGLIVGGGLLLVAGLLGIVGKSQVQQGVPPVPQEAAESVQRDVESVRERVRR
ncbi:putative superfamily III holin-X [Prauserella shujinwangii]|uniref:Putative superfamily III holin-X n=1 Tax=Prauserella shujinwangii TaxID=1453103 RepID=A0A2T0LX62_9PSEU|nr:phage holin family protein [Prauserella shujinwangii]PRX48615.1 putative superfamily III holin-X [Prauserella shujinwangii]